MRSEAPAGTDAKHDVMFVANAEGGTVSAFDAHSFDLLRTYDVLPDGPAPSLTDDPEQALLGQQLVELVGGKNYAQDLDVSPDGRTLYVSRGHRGDVAAFDLASGELLWRLPIAGLRADHMTLSADGSTLYLSAMTDDHVYAIDTAQHAIIGSFASGQWPHDNHVSPDGKRLYNASIGNIVLPEEVRALQSAAPVPGVPIPYQITVVDAQTLTVLKTYAFDAGVRPFEITRDEKRIYAQLSQQSAVVEFDLERGAITRRLDLPVKAGTSEEDYDFEAPHHGLALSHDETTLCLAGRISDYVALVSTTGLELLATIPVGDAPGWAATTPDGRHCFVPNNRDDTVSVISYEQRKEVARLPAGDGPKYTTGARVPESVICPSDACGNPGASDTTTSIHFSNAFGMYRSIVYVPAFVGRDRPAPLVMMLHGANTTAEQQRALSLFDPLAKRERFIVMYPDHETNSQIGLHPLQSWHFYDPLEMQRDFGDTEALAALTRQVMQEWNVDPERVYIVGSSAGGYMASILGATYPDIYAAISVVEAGGYGIGLAGFAQPIGPTVVRPELTALLAYQAMGSHARVVPMINFQGDRDTAAPPETGAHAVQQWLMTNNLVESGGPYAPFPLTPTETIENIPPNGYPYDVDIYRDAGGCRVVEQIRIKGMAHFWPGGSDDPELDGYTDPLAPDGAELSWAFLKRFRKSDTGLPCVEAGP